MDEIHSYDYSLLLRNAYRILRVQAVISLEKFSLNPTQWALLGILHKTTDGVSISETASKIGVKVPLITVMADDLVKKQLIHKIQNKEDSRSKLLSLTDKGNELVHIVESALDDAFRPILKGVTKREMAGFQKVLERISHNEPTA